MEKITEKAFELLAKIGWRAIAEVEDIIGAVSGYVNWTGGVFVFEYNGEYFKTSTPKIVKAVR